MSFVVGPDAAIVRPLDNVPGYYIRDGDPAQPLTGILAKGGLLLPGPTSAQAWDSAGSANSLVLVGTDGQPTSTRITLPNPGWPSQSAMSDGRGDVLVASDSGSQYDAGPHFLRLVGVLLSAVGPTRWLAMDCPSGHCRNVVFNPKTGTERTLPGPPVHLLTWPWPAYPGSVAPDGQTAAVVADSGNGHVVLEELNLTTGTVTRLAVPVSENTSSQTMAWSPDSKWLFVAAANGIAARGQNAHAPRPAPRRAWQLQSAGHADLGTRTSKPPGRTCTVSDRPLAMTSPSTWRGSSASALISIRRARSRSSC